MVRNAGEALGVATPFGQAPRVVPAPHTNNLAPISCANAALGPNVLPIASRQGSATADIFPPGS